mgnify:FL=1
MINSTDFEPAIRKCTPEDLDKIMKLQEHICQTMEDTRLFVSTSREENRDYLIYPNTILGVFDGEKLIAYGSLVFPNDSPENIGWDLDWTREKIFHCLTLDTIVVDPDYRGHGLQRTLIRSCVAYALELMPDATVLTTVSPFNKYSLHNVQAEGFQILKRKEKYGGYDRYILGYTQAPDTEFPAFVPGPDAVILPMENILQNPELPTGCESVALTMVLNYYGQKLSKTTIADEYLIRDSENFVTAYKGDPYQISGDGIYAPGLAQTAARYLQANHCPQTATDLTGTEFTKLYQYLDKSAPVIVYNSVYLKTPIDVASYTLSGKTWHFYHNEHCVVLCGYDPAGHMVLINDSLSGLVWRSEEAFARIYDQLGKMAVLIC